jgi:hypothetical protein
MRDLPEYVSREAGAKLLSVSAPTFARLAAEGRFASITLPGLPTRYLAADVLALKSSCVKPALVGAES